VGAGGTLIDAGASRRYNEAMQRGRRLADLDAVRAALVFAVVVFHGLRVFDPFDFYVKGPRIDALAPVILLGGLVGMPLFFLFAGMSLWHSMGRRRPVALVRERLCRRSSSA
jgi:peptidoglycan/LPS O-acetylase OafA/YrhL